MSASYQIEIREDDPSGLILNTENYESKEQLIAAYPELKSMIDAEIHFIRWSSWGEDAEFKTYWLRAVSDEIPF